MNLNNLATVPPRLFTTAEALAAQTELARLGLYDGHPDGLFGSVSRAALTAYRLGATEIIDHVGGVRVYRTKGGEIVFTSGLTIDADGDPKAYHPAGSPGLDALGNAGGPGNWFGIVTSDGEPDGNPVIQGAADPAPGYYVSSTALQNPGFERWQQRRYLNSGEIPFVVLPGRRFKEWGCRLGDFATLQRLDGGLIVPAVCGDVGPFGHLGEASIAAARALAITSNPRTGGVKDGVVYRVAPGSSRGFPLSAASIAKDSPLLSA